MRSNSRRDSRQVSAQLTDEVVSRRKAYIELPRKREYIDFAVRQKYRVCVSKHIDKIPVPPYLALPMGELSSVARLRGQNISISNKKPNCQKVYFLTVGFVM